MSQKLVTIKSATANVTAVGVRINGEATTEASKRLTALMAHNNGKDLREDSQRREDKGSALANIYALLSASTKSFTLAEARSAYREGSLNYVVAPTALFTKGTTPASVNMSLDRDAKAFGFGVKVTARAFTLDNNMVVIYCGNAK